MMQRIASYLAQGMSPDEISDLLDYPLDALRRLVDTPMMNLAVQQLKDAGEMGVDHFMQASDTLTFEWRDHHDDDSEGEDS